MAPMSRTGPWLASVFAVSIPNACSDARREGRDRQGVEPPAVGQHGADDDQDGERRDVLGGVPVGALRDEHAVGRVGRHLVAGVAADRAVPGDVGAQGDEQDAHEGDADDGDGVHASCLSVVVDRWCVSR